MLMCIHYLKGQKQALLMNISWSLRLLMDEEIRINVLNDVTGIACIIKPRGEML